MRPLQRYAEVIAAAVLRADDHRRDAALISARLRAARPRLDAATKRALRRRILERLAADRRYFYNRRNRPERLARPNERPRGPGGRFIPQTGDLP